MDTSCTTLTDSQQVRFARQILLDEVGERGQLKLQNAKVLIVGAGGLGVPMATYLASVGIGHLGLADGDIIEYSNLHRQVAYATEDVGLNKTAQLKQRLLSNNPNTEIIEYPRLDANNALEIISQYDLVADGCDNFPSRYLINEVCVKTKTPLVATALSKYDGQIMAFTGGAPCYQCLMGHMSNSDYSQGCVEGGILGPVAGIFGCWQALEVIKQLLNMPSRLNAQVLIVDVMNNRNRNISFGANPQCSVCGESK